MHHSVDPVAPTHTSPVPRSGPTAMTRRPGARPAAPRGAALGVALALLLTAAGCSDDVPPVKAPGDESPNNDPNNGPGPICGDGACGAGESAASCAQDCETPNNEPGPACGDGACGAGEQATCPDDCETPNNEPGPVCGDGACDPNESPQSCAEDCGAAQCEADHARCLDPQTLELCNQGQFQTAPCEAETRCVEDACVPVVCQPGAPIGCESRTEVLLCNETGTGEVSQPCPGVEFCTFVGEGFTCTDQICPPNQIRCRGLEGLEICAQDGRAWEIGPDCESGTQCDSGECKSLCEINSKVSSFLGCEYWSTDLDNIAGGLNSAHAVIISNPHPEITAEISVTDGRGNPVRVTGWPTSVPPGELAIWPFAQNAINLETNQSLVNTSLVDNTIIADQTWQFISSVPVTAHQFNPLVDTNVFTNDASLLLPTNSLGNEYLVMSWKHRGSGFQLRGFVTIIAVGEEPTTVTVTPTASVMAGSNLLTNAAIERIPPGETRQLVLMPGQLLNLETEGPEGADLTGTEILTDQPAVVFAGHECANVPLGFDACDHLEQQMYPVPAWGSQYIGTHFSPRDPNTPQSEVYRILAGADQVTLTTTPSIANVDGLTLDRGEFVEFETNVDFELLANGPILPGQYITGTSYRGGGSGDPAFTLLVPVEQWRRDYIVLTPPAYEQGDFLNIAAPIGAVVLLDGEPIDEDLFVPLSGGSYTAAIVPASDGPHTLTSDSPFTVIAYGYDSAVSYAYPGGLNLEAVRR